MDGGAGAGGDDELRRLGLCFAVCDDRGPDETIRRQKHCDAQPKTREAIRTVKNSAPLTPEEHFLQFTEGFKLFKGKIADVLRETRGAFNYGKVVLEGIGEYKDRQAFVQFQNENLLASVDGEILATTPDLICLVDTETF